MDIQSPSVSMVTRSGRKRKSLAEREEIKTPSKRTRTSVSKDSSLPLTGKDAAMNDDILEEDEMSLGGDSVSSESIRSASVVATPSGVSSLNYADLSAQRKMRRRSIPHPLSHRATPSTPIPASVRSSPVVVAPSPFNVAVSSVPRRLSRRGKGDEAGAVDSLAPLPPLSLRRKKPASSDETITAPDKQAPLPPPAVMPIVPNPAAANASSIAPPTAATPSINPAVWLLMLTLLLSPIPFLLRNSASRIPLSPEGIYTSPSSLGSASNQSVPFQPPALDALLIWDLTWDQVEGEVDVLKGVDGSSLSTDVSLILELPPPPAPQDEDNTLASLVPLATSMDITLSIDPVELEQEVQLEELLASSSPPPEVSESFTDGVNEVTTLRSDEEIPPITLPGWMLARNSLDVDIEELEKPLEETTVEEVGGETHELPGLRDFACAPRGGRIVGRHTSPCLRPLTSTSTSAQGPLSALKKGFGQLLRALRPCPSPPSLVINYAPPRSFDDCFCFSGTTGHVSVSFANVVELSELQLLHWSDPDQFSSAPNTFSVIGFGEDQAFRQAAQGVDMGTFRFLPGNATFPGEHFYFQSFSLSKVSAVKSIMLRVLDNHGADKTCLYRVRAMGAHRLASQ
eukprot:gene28484-34384_t